MTLTRLTAALAATCLATIALAEDILIEDAYARASNPRAGAAFMVIHNHGSEDDRLIDVRSDAAARVELHTHQDMGDGVMKMIHVEEGIALPAGGSHALARGGDHVMFMGLTAPFEQGATVAVTLTFERAGEIDLAIPVDLERQPQAHGVTDHGAHDHGATDHDAHDHGATDHDGHGHSGH
ncbi:copper chaperone PCu(A)C [Marinovum sp.]|uniref:copper chaperone PCu(A)C n=1 Tax=Marinovum sp. TaxID=2024839 RepID=UPI002B275D82|nr:copper chaperone PCu(A)C [Marinovum sp.]